ncbi:uncharacterized protein BDZ83DRAFT_66003 [Colletotrichum acutatum]|uniref:Secreted protein n=1 Tax=Glomerella acutata TaxID=27357 RepID=A0AAD8XKL6_GLOAC|nr:uncharacterized protein BDZ83DRAFT_66003 [Colletotrichum acutatum]KAK1729079.1 hypothetical protein BDZ83DRAFT_66003 [Colletotrichum acutatum]
MGKKILLRSLLFLMDLAPCSGHRATPLPPWISCASAPPRFSSTPPPPLTNRPSLQLAPAESEAMRTTKNHIHVYKVRLAGRWACSPLVSACLRAIRTYYRVWGYIHERIWWTASVSKQSIRPSCLCPKPSLFIINNNLSAILARL